MKELTVICEPDVFTAWLGTAEKGAAIEYHRGMLCADRETVEEDKDTTEEELRLNIVARCIGRVGNLAMKAYDDRLVRLVQRRHGPHDYSYLAIRR